ncbi:hypothetical protein NEOLEDRAFT_1038593, partial [Neolentinus lepideus HHB14362 ss-1]
TFASAPTFIGITSLLNDVRLSKKLPPSDLLDPLLYTKGVTGLTDITGGDNP